MERSQGTFLEEVRAAWKRFDGDRLFVRYRANDADRHYMRAKLIQVPSTGERVEVLPLSGHKKTEWMYTHGMTWWTSENKRIHPEWMDFIREIRPSEAEAETGLSQAYYIIDTQQWFWCGWKFAPSFTMATEYVLQATAQRALTRLNKRFQNQCKMVTTEEAHSIAAKNGWSTIEEEDQLIALPPPVPPPTHVQIGKEETPVEMIPAEDVKVLDTSLLLARFREFKSAWQLYVESGTRFLDEVEKLLE